MQGPAMRGAQHALVGSHSFADAMPVSAQRGSFTLSLEQSHVFSFCAYLLSELSPTGHTGRVFVVAARRHSSHARMEGVGLPLGPLPPGLVSSHHTAHAAALAARAVFGDTAGMMRGLGRGRLWGEGPGLSLARRVPVLPMRSLVLE